VHRCHGYPIHGAAHELNPRPSSALADDRYVVLHRDHCDDHLCVNELDRHDAAHRFVDALDDHQNCVDDHHHDADVLVDPQSDHVMRHDRDDPQNDRELADGHHHDADALDDPQSDHVLQDDLNQNCASDLDDRQNGHVLMDDHHHGADDLDASRDLQTCHQLMDGPMTDDRDRLDDHRHHADDLDDLQIGHVL